MMLVLAHLAYLLIMPIWLIGLINRTKARWAGRQGPGLFQLAHDLRRLLAKRAVYSGTTTAVLRVGAPVVLATTLLASLVAPVLPGFAPLSFSYDFVAIAYLMGLGRVALMLSALDTGSAFEGMGASREALLSVVAEPAWFLVFGALAETTGHATLAELTILGADWALIVPAVLALVLLLQVEAARVPVDDPATHLELTMIHEVMILDHSGPELAAMQYAAAMKLAIYAGLIAALANPISALAAPLESMLVSAAIASAVAIAVGCVESTMARLRMRLVPLYALGAAALGLVVLIAATGVRELL